MRHIANCTLVIIDTLNYEGAIHALGKSMEQNSFDRVIFFTDKPLEIEGVDTIIIHKLSSKREYSFFCVKELWKYINTDFVLTIQHDGFTLNGDLFDDRLYEYDYAGALWLDEGGYENGNGGYVWKSTKLLEAVGGDENIKVFHPEDVQLSRTYRNYLEEKYGLKWAPDEICERFSFELREPKCPTMGFHGYFHQSFRPTIILERAAALGDCIRVEPVARYFYNKGFNVVLDMPIHFFTAFLQHDFPVKHISDFDSGRIKAIRYDLNMAYERKPKQLHLKSYYEACGIEAGELVNPKLSLNFDPKAKENKLFPKYAVIHADIRNEPSRCVYGLDWGRIVIVLQNQGYTVIQVGEGLHTEIKGAIQMKTPTIPFLMWVIGGCDLFVGIDSGISHLAAGFNIPSVIFSGSVDLRYIHADLSNICWIHNHDEDVCPKEKRYCWHSVIGTTGAKCSISDLIPPCVDFNTDSTIEKIKNFIDDTKTATVKRDY